MQGYNHAWASTPNHNPRHYPKENKYAIPISRISYGLRNTSRVVNCHNDTTVIVDSVTFAPRTLTGVLVVDKRTVLQALDCNLLKLKYQLALPLRKFDNMTRPQIRRVAVIGAGISGVVSAAHLLNAGLEVTVFERSHAAGGVWCALLTL